MDSHGSLSAPTTPYPPHATIPEATTTAIPKMQSSRIATAANGITPPPSAQVAPSNRPKTRTPTPTLSHISTPPPTIDTQTLSSHLGTSFAGPLSAAEIASAPAEELRRKVMEMQVALHEAKMSAAHHKLQYNMLSQESAAAIERMVVEARMTQYENDVIHIAEQNKAAVAPAQPPQIQEGMIPVQKELYQRMCCEIQQLSGTNRYLEREHAQQEKMISKQESEIASLSDKVLLMQERIRENREHINRMRGRPTATSRTTSAQHSVYNTPSTRVHQAQPQSQQPFAALLQASEMARQEGSRKKGHSRNIHSLSSLPATPGLTQKPSQPIYHTPLGRHMPAKLPSTAPMPRTSATRTPNATLHPNMYAHPNLTVPIPHVPGPASDGTVSASDQDNNNDDDDSEAETDILSPEDEVQESQASRTASQMLSSSSRPESQQTKRKRFQGAGMLEEQEQAASERERTKQTKLFGAVRKPNVERTGDDGGPPGKRARGAAAPPSQPPVVGLGIAGVRD